MRKPGVGNPADRCRLPAEMYGVRASDHDAPQTGGEKHKGFTEKSLKETPEYGIILIRDT